MERLLHREVRRREPEAGRPVVTDLVAPIRVSGLREVQKALKELDGESQKELRLTLNEAAGIVVRVAQRRTPVLTGAARSSIRATSGQRESRVSAGGRKAPYFPWLDYGGTTGRGHAGKSGNAGFSAGSVKRPFLKGGRYIYPAYSDQYANIRRLLDKRLNALLQSKGIETS